MIAGVLRVLLRLLGFPVGPRRHPRPESWETRRVVGTCGTCGGEVVYSPRARLASCAGGCSVIPRAMLAPAVRP